MPYRAPLGEIRFLLDHVAGFAQVAATARFAEAGPDSVAAILAGAARLSEEVLAPLSRAGDLHPARIVDGKVLTPPGFAAAYRTMAAGGWIGLTARPESGGMGLPQTLAVAVHDMMAGANLALHLLPLLAMGQIEALERHADPALQAIFLPRLTAGDWTATMNLTEPQAGSDVGAIRTRAEPGPEGTFRITGQKIYITWADHDFGGNVCHLVLARLPDAPSGTKGLSLFLVPKFLPDAQGRPGQPNALRVAGLEHKLGLHGSPTATMVYDGATGWLVGPSEGGMAAMFTMMNNARVGVGAQGVGIAEAAAQAAAAHALSRVQGRTANGATIAGHPDVRRMLATLRAEVLAARSIVLMCGVAIDMAAATGDPAWAARAGVLTPIAKAFGTDIGCEAAQTAIQVHGGAGVIEATGVAQLARDVRVTAIYEGTNGIQAGDLVGRKLADGGVAALRLIAEVEAAARAAPADFGHLAAPVQAAAAALAEATRWLLAQGAADRAAGSVPYLRAFARVLGAGAHLAAARAGDDARRRLAAFYILRLLPEHAALLAQVRAGAAGLMAMPDADFAPGA
jgi:alkylation response protein AidB-like acyl-CoA dehydrogenase